MDYFFIKWALWSMKLTVITCNDKYLWAFIACNSQGYFPFSLSVSLCVYISIRCYPCSFEQHPPLHQRKVGPLSVLHWRPKVQRIHPLGYPTPIDEINHLSNMLSKMCSEFAHKNGKHLVLDFLHLPLILESFDSIMHPNTQHKIVADGHKWNKIDS